MNFFLKVKFPTLPQTAREGWGTPVGFVCTFFAAVRKWALDTGFGMVLNRGSRKKSIRSFSYDKKVLC